MTKDIWVITNGTQANQIQAFALASRLPGKKINLVRRIDNWQRFLTMKTVSKSPGLLSQLPIENLPKVVIGCGRHSIPYLLSLKKTYQDAIKTIYILDPRISPSYFDLVVSKEMDPVNGENVIKSFGSIHSLSTDYLQTKADTLTPLLSSLPPPYLFVSIGGGSKTCRYLFTKGRCLKLIKFLDNVISSFSGSILITPSRRTGNNNIELLSNHYANNKKVYFDQSGSSDIYHGMLGIASYCLISNDSINMLTEACIRDIPIYHFKLPYFIHSGKFRRFIKTLETRKLVTPFKEKFENTSHTVFNESIRISDIVKQKFLM